MEIGHNACELSTTSVHPCISLRLLRQHEIESAARLVGRGMCSNPANVAVFRAADAAQRAKALERFFIPVLQGLYRRGLVLGAFRSQELVGISGIARPGFCQPKLFEKLTVLPAAVIGNSASTPLRLLEWVREWSGRDPAEPHWHLGPVAVEPQLQRQGIGSTMLGAFCSLVDSCRSLAYLETDKEENVRLYRRFGFRVVASAEVLGVPNWFMSRPPQANAALVGMSEVQNSTNPNTNSPASYSTGTSHENPGIVVL